MPRDVDERKKRKALRKLRKAAELAEAGLGPPLSDWEQTFLDEVEARIEKYGSAFADPSKGDLEEPLSALQSHKLKEIDKKARGKGGRGLKSKKPAYTPRGRDINDDVVAEAAPEPAPKQDSGAAARPSGPPKLRIIEGGGGKPSS